MDVMASWTGREAHILRRALRMSTESFADHLGIAVRTVAYWSQKPDTVPQPVAQEALDTVLAQAPEPTRAQFMQLLSADKASTPTSGANYRADETNKAVLANHQEWLTVRRNLGNNRAELTRLAAQLYPPSARLGSTSILMPEDWRLRTPVPLASVKLLWQESAPVPAITGQHEETIPLRPLTAPGQRYTRYHRAVRDLDRPRLFENRLCYRLLGARIADDGDSQSIGMNLTLGNMCYFDMIDVGEALAHELALTAVDSQGNVNPDRVTWDNLPFRRLARDPFDLADYPLMLSVSTLTIRRSTAGTTFLLLRRNPAKVAIAGGMLSVFPTGVFQPASVASAPNSPDFDLWRNVMREYSEEYLGNPEHDGDGPPIDYENAEPFRTLDNALREGKISVSCLGIGIDALNYVGDVLTVAIYQADFFDQMFGNMVEENDEGNVERQAYNFDGQTIERLLNDEPFAPSGAACLQLAWEHRVALDLLDS